MILPVHELVRDRITSALGRLYALEGEAVPPIVIDYPPNRELGDLAVPLAFELAKRLRKAPKMIAEQIAAELAAVPGIARVEATKGYLNLFLDRAEFLRRALAAAPAAKQKLRPTAPEAARVDANAVKTIVEHTAINPNKAAHIGHLRNSALGDTLVRVLRFRGVPVEVQNYIDDTGVQVADVVVGFRELENKNLAAVRRDRRHDAFRLLLLGPLREGGRVVRGRQGTPPAPLGRRCTTSSTAGTMPPRWPPSSPIASSAATC